MATARAARRMKAKRIFEPHGVQPPPSPTLRKRLVAQAALGHRVFRVQASTQASKVGTARVADLPLDGDEARRNAETRARLKSCEPERSAPLPSLPMSRRLEIDHNRFQRRRSSRIDGIGSRRQNDRRRMPLSFRDRPSPYAPRSRGIFLTITPKSGSPDPARGVLERIMSCRGRTRS